MPLELGDLAGWAQPSAPPPAWPDLALRWRVLVTRGALADEMVVGLLGGLDIEAYRPTEPWVVRKGRSAARVTVRRPIMPGYVLALIDQRDEPVVCEAQTAAGVRPVVAVLRGVVPDAEVSALRAVLDRREHPFTQSASPCPFRPGQTVRIVSGAGEGTLTRIERIAGRGKVSVLLDILGAPRMADIDFDRLEDAE